MIDQSPVSFKFYWRNYAAFAVAGEVADSKSRTDYDIRTSGGGGTTIGGTGFQQSIQTEIIQTDHQQIFLRDKDGDDTVMKFVNFQVDCLPGHKLAAAYVDPAREENKWLVVYNRGTKTLQFNEKLIEKLQRSWILNTLLFFGIAIAVWFIGTFGLKWNAIIMLILALLLGAVGLGTFEGWRSAKFIHSPEMKQITDKLKSLADSLA